jgi:hypothetical protein
MLRELIGLGGNVGKQSIKWGFITVALSFLAIIMLGLVLPEPDGSKPLIYDLYDTARLVSCIMIYIGFFGGVLGFTLGIIKSFLDRKPAEITVKEGDTIMGDKRIEVVLGDYATIHGDFVVANSIKDSFNKADSATNDALSDLLKELAAAVGKMSELLPKEKAREVATDLAVLTDEATREKPRRRWWELSIEGLTKAAEDVGEIGTPVIQTATKIASFLLAM